MEFVKELPHTGSEYDPEFVTDGLGKPRFGASVMMCGGLGIPSEKYLGLFLDQGDNKWLTICVLDERETRSILRYAIQDLL